MKPRHEWATLHVDELEKQIEIRKNLLNQMVGTLYSGIVEDECRHQSRCAQGSTFG